MKINVNLISYLSRAPVALQVNHAGGATTRDVCGVQPMIPSSIMLPLSFAGVRERARHVDYLYFIKSI